jgi:peptide-methionine (R)-S-oxide reductase
MNNRRAMLGAILGAGIAGWIASGRESGAADAGVFPIMHPDGDWRRLLTPAQYRILRQQGTEPPGSSPLDHEFRPGRYDCVGCAKPLFSSATKFDSGTGWPSFFAPLADAVATTTDTSLLMRRTEVHCANCGGHLGHVFSDGPRPTGQRYCMNGAVLAFHPETA